MALGDNVAALLEAKERYLQAVDSVKGALGETDYKAHAACRLAVMNVGWGTDLVCNAVAEMGDKK